MAWRSVLWLHKACRKRPQIGSIRAKSGDVPTILAPRFSVALLKKESREHASRVSQKFLGLVVSRFGALRGATKCEGGKCKCADGSCSWKGSCFPVTDTGGTCHALGCDCDGTTSYTAHFPRTSGMSAGVVRLLESTVVM